MPAGKAEIRSILIASLIASAVLAAAPERPAPAPNAPSAKTGSSTTEYPWGRLTDTERLTYDVADDLGSNGVSSISGLAETSIVLPGRVLAWRADLDLKSDTKNFYYRLHRELLRDGSLVRQKTWEETIPRDHQ